MPKIIHFSGRDWTVKSSEEPVGPGPSFFSDSNESVWVDGNGFLHLKIRYINGHWNSAEVVTTQTLGYGRYIVNTSSRIDLLDRNVVLGMFTYDPTDPYVHYRELDIEISKWGDENNLNGQFVVQPDKIQRFPINLNGDWSSHVIDWTAQRIYFQMIHGHYQYAPSYQYFIRQWTFEDYPIYSGNEKFIINLWQAGGHAPSNGKQAQVVIKRFDFIPV